MERLGDPRNFNKSYVVPRAGSLEYFTWTMPDISSTWIRELIAAHKTNEPFVENMLPKKVFDYIVENKLYKMA